MIRDLVQQADNKFWLTSNKESGRSTHAVWMLLTALFAGLLSPASALATNAFATQNSAPSVQDQLPARSAQGSTSVLDQEIDKEIDDESVGKAKSTDVQVGDVKQKSDQELTLLTAQWGKLSSSERRVLLAEVRSRMQRKQAARTQVMPRVRVTRRYGRIVRQPDGSVVVQTRVVRPRSLESQVNVQNGTSTRVAPRGRITFGFGFERRVRTAPKPPVTETAAQAESGTATEVLPTPEP